MRNEVPSSKTIILIDKDPAVIDLISILLSDEGHRTIVANVPFDMAEVRAIRPDLILLHNSWDNLGAEICRQLKTDPEIRSIPIILSSTNSSLTEIARERGADYHILRPFDINDFCALIDHALEK